MIQAGKKHARWMEDLLTQGLGCVKIENLIIPGTHDSAAYKTGSFHGSSFINKICNIFILGSLIKAIVKPLVITQQLTIKEQLESGARYLDLRLAFDEQKNSFFLSHTVCCISLEEALNQVHHFMQENPHEIVFLAFKPDSANRATITKASSYEFFNRIKQKMVGKLWENAEGTLIGKKSLAELKGKAVVCYSDSDQHYTQLHRWQTANGALIHATHDGGNLKGQLETHWENKPTARELLIATANKASQLNYSGKVIQLDGAPTPNAKRAALTILWRITLAWNIGLLLKLLHVTSPIGIKHEAHVFAGGYSALRSKPGKGYLLSVDFLAASSTSRKMISDYIAASNINAKQSALLQKKLASPKEEQKIVKEEKIFSPLFLNKKSPAVKPTAVAHPNTKEVNTLSAVPAK